MGLNSSACSTYFFISLFASFITLDGKAFSARRANQKDARAQMVILAKRQNETNQRAPLELKACEAE